MTLAGFLHILLVILLTILKVIGWILLVLLLLIVLILLIVGLCPFRYRLSGSLNRDIKESTGSGDVSWLWGIVRVIADYENHELKTRLKILWISKDMSASEDDVEEKVQEELEELENLKEKSGDILKDAGQAVVEYIQENDSAKIDDPQNEKNSDIRDEETSDTATIPDDTKPGPIERLKKSVKFLNKEKRVEPSDREEAGENRNKEIDTVKMAEELRAKIEHALAEIFIRFAEIHEKRIKFQESTQAKIDKIKAKADPALEFIQDEKVIKALKHVIRELVDLVVSVLPRTMGTDIKYSAGSPDTTGKIYAVFFMLPLAYKNKWSVEPDFMEESSYVEGEITMTGKVRLGILLEILFRLLIDFNVWHTVRAGLALRKKEQEIDKEFE